MKCALKRHTCMATGLYDHVMQTTLPIGRAEGGFENPPLRSELAA